MRYPTFFILIDFLPNFLILIYMSVNDTNSVITTPTASNLKGVQNGNIGSTKLQDFGIYEGIVEEVDYLSKRLTVFLNNRLVYNCVYAVNSIASLIGFSSTQLPGIGERVICLYTSQTTWIIGTQPHYKRNIKQYAGDITGAIDYSQIGDKDLGLKRKTNSIKINDGYPTSRDLLPGEEELTNNIGVALRLLTNLAQLDAGGLAKIECHLMNDMVRIVDGYYAHHHCGGDTLIWNNGRNNLEDHFTPYPHEAAGKEKEDEDYLKPKEPFDQQDVFGSEADSINGTGRWRKSTYIGFLGDMMHYWITNPVTVLSNYAQESARAARFKTWVGSDGTLMVQAAGDIMIQVTQHMIIPEMHYKWDNPDCDPDKLMKDLDTEYLKIWGTGERYWGDMTVACWQMRSYLKYITVWHSLQRFRQLAKKDEQNPFCTIKPEVECHVGNTDCEEEDKKEAGATTPPGSGAALLHISPSGSISLISGDSTSCIMSNGSIQLAAPANIEIKAGNTFSVTAKDVSIKASRNIELASLFGSICAKARSAFKILCELGRVWIKGDAPNDAVDTPQGLPAEFNKYSIVLDSAQGETLVHGHRGVTVGSDSIAGKVTIQATGSTGIVNIYAKHKIKLYTKGKMFITAAAMGIHSLVTKVKGTSFKIFKNLKVTANCLDFAGLIRSTYLRTPNIMYAHLGYQTSQNPNVGTTQEEYRPKNLEESIPKPEDKTADDIAEQLEKLKEKDIKLDYNKEEFLNGKEQWSFFKWDIPNNTANNTFTLKAGPFDDTIMNCQTSIEGWVKSKFDTIKWNDPTLKLRKAPRTDTKTLPWPGAGASMFVFSDQSITTPINAPMDCDFEPIHICSAADMRPKVMQYHFIK